MIYAYYQNEKGLYEGNLQKLKQKLHFALSELVYCGVVVFDWHFRAAFD